MTAHAPPLAKTLALPLDQPVGKNGYAWWYFDGLSDDGRHGFTAILFVGGIFSTRYYDARRKGGDVDPLDHCVANICLYGERQAWAITEWPRRAVERRPTALTIGKTDLRLADGRWTLDFDERTAPWRQPLRGSITVTPSTLRDEVVTLSQHGGHKWYPMAPCGRFEANLENPRLRFSGHAYQDANSGSGPVEAAMRSWTWSRASDGARAERTWVLYDVDRRHEAPLSLAASFAADGTRHDFSAPAWAALPGGGYGMSRRTRSDDGRATLLSSYVDAPFYTRALVETHLEGQRLQAVHEAADMDRFVRPWVQFLLPFKMRTVA